MNYKIMRLVGRPELKEEAAKWFHEKWGIPLEAYLESINVCALFVAEDHRCNGVAGALLDYVCIDMKDKGIAPLYLVTDHISFYERYGWEFLCMVQGDGEPDMTRMYIHR